MNQYVGLDVSQKETSVCVRKANLAATFQEPSSALHSLRWGLVPSWWPKPLKELKAATFNARAGAVAEKPFFRDAFRRTRCLIPASGYYEWQNTASGKQPWYFARAVAITRKPCSMSSSVSSRPKPVEQPVISQIGFCSLSSASVLLHLRTQRSTIAIMFAL